MKLLGEVVLLMNESDLHKEWSASDVFNIIRPPLLLDQHVTHRENGLLVGFGTWAFMNDQSLDDFLNGRRRVEFRDFVSGNNVVLVDVIAPKGHGRFITSEIRKSLVKQGYKGKTIKYVRYYGPDRVAKESLL